MIKGLIIPGHILLSDKTQRVNGTKTHEGALLQSYIIVQFILRHLALYVLEKSQNFHQVCHKRYIK